MKTYDLKTATIENSAFNYFYSREKNDANGNPRFRVYVIDPDGPAVYESIFKCYESQIPDRVAAFIENVAGVTVPF
jgi:hypothetical protein